MSASQTLVTLKRAGTGPVMAFQRLFVPLMLTLLCLNTGTALHGTPANRSSLERHYDRFLSKELATCVTCHLPGTKKDPQSLEEFPHNPYGDRLRQLGQQLAASKKPRDIGTRLAAVSLEDSDGDGAANEVELLLGHNPGNREDKPSQQELASLKGKQAEFKKFLASYQWKPFETVRKPPVPKVKNKSWVRNPIDAFIAADHQLHELRASPEASKPVLLRRLHLDLIGLSPTPEEQRQFLADNSSRAYEKVVDRLLADPRYGERWGRHWMDVWRYSDWAGWSDGNQIRDSKPHIWRWRDWIVESLNADKGYDRMVLEMLAADEATPLDENALRATGFLVRNYKMLSREQWMEDTIKHTSQAFLGVTVGCAKCHDHMTEPISQRDYYRLRAVFDPHNIRTDRLPGELDTAKLGLVRAYDTTTNAITYLFVRGDERHPDTNQVMEAAVPPALCGSTALKLANGRLTPQSVDLPFFASQPDRREFVIQDLIAASGKAIQDARIARENSKTNSALSPEKLKEMELGISVAEAKCEALMATLKVEEFERNLGKEAESWRTAATEAVSTQRKAAVEEAKLKHHQNSMALSEAQRKSDELSKASSDPAKPKADVIDKAAKEIESARKKLTEGEKSLADAEKELQAAPNTAYKPRPVESYPATSTGRRLAFARWLTETNNPLTARVAMNHLWLRHFGRGIVPTPSDFGRNGRPPSHPQLLDWLAGEFTAREWSMKAMHRLIVTSSTYRMASTPDALSAKSDPDNIHLWRMPSRRMEAEVVRDNVLHVTGNLDSTMGGPDIDHKLGLTSMRRSLYLRLAAEKEVEFLKIFDGPSVTECYERRPSVMPQQALALANSELAISQARLLAASLGTGARNDQDFVRDAFVRILAREAKQEELELCAEFLAEHANVKPELTKVSTVKDVPTGASGRARENLILVLFNHNDFVTIR